MKKRLLFTSYNIGSGGIGTSLINILNDIDYNKYEVTLILISDDKTRIELIPKEVKIVFFNYKENGIIGKIKNRLKLNYYVLKYKNKFDFSACFTPFCFNSAYIARNVCKNSNFWVHADYYTLYKEDKNKVIEFFENKKIKKFKRVIFVSESGLNNAVKIMPYLKEKSYVCNNLLNVNTLMKKYNEEVDDPIIRENNETIFLNVSRHDEKEKSITRIIEASKMLKEENQNFKVYLIGDGQDNKMYKDMVKKYSLENTCIFKGFKNNPYPYFKNVDAHILCSDSEGYPVVIVETLTLKINCISTDVSDVKQIFNGNNNLLIEKSSQGVYNGMKKVIENKNLKKIDFNIDNYNNIIKEFLEKIYNDMEDKNEK